MYLIFQQDLADNMLNICSKYPVDPLLMSFKYPVDNSPNPPTHWSNIQTQSSGLRWAVIGYSVGESAGSTIYCLLVCSESFAYTKSMPSKYSNRVQWVEVNCYYISLSRRGEQCQSCIVRGQDAPVNLARCSHVACMGVMSLLMWDAFKGVKKHMSKARETSLPFYIVCEVQIFDEKETVHWKWTCCGMTSLQDADFWLKMELLWCDLIVRCGFQSKKEDMWCDLLQ